LKWREFFVRQFRLQGKNMFLSLRETTIFGKFIGTRNLAFAALLLCFANFACAQPASKSLYQGFANPPADARPMMRWWWFGPATVKPELQKELETMRNAGIGGVEVQPVYPLMLDDPAKGIRNYSYLSPEFLDDVSFANRTARSLGLRVDITLGSGWPYGGPKTTIALSAGKLKVVAVPYEARPIDEVASMPPLLANGDMLIAAFIVKGTAKSFDPASALRFNPPGPGPLLGSGYTLLYFISSHTGQQVKRAAFGAEGYVLDHFSRAAIDEHLNDVAVPLVKAFGNQPPYSVFSDSLEVYGSDWTQQLPAEFQKRRGYDLIPHLPELFAGGTPQAEAVRHDWGQTLSELVRDNYLEPITQFAGQSHSQFRSQTYGEPAVTLADEAIPNLPEGEGPQWRAFSFTRWASSASHLYDRNVTSAETWTWLDSPAFRATPLDMKAEADKMFLLGVNQIVGHGWPYSPPGAGEPGWSLYAAAVFNAHNPWFPVMPDITKYLQRVSWLLRQGKPANDVAILLPEDDAQAAFTPGHVSVTDEMKKRITPALMSAILDAGYNIDYIDCATIEKLGTIPYPVVVIPPTDRISLATYRKIASYAAGGKVIALGKLPSIGPGLKDEAESAAIASLSQSLFKSPDAKGILVDSVEQLPATLHSVLRPDVEVTGQNAGFGFIHRKLADSDIYFVANTGNAVIDGRVQFRAHRPNVEEWDPDSGKALSTGQHADTDRIPLTLAPYQSRVFVLTDRPSLANGQRDLASAKWNARTTDLNKGWQIQFAGSTANQPLPTLTSWTELSDRRFYSGEADYTRTIDVPFAPKPGAHVLLDFGPGTPTVDTRPPGANGTHALLDPPIREAAIVYINGKQAGSLWHPPYRIEITALVHGGQNRVEVRVYNTAINELAGQPPRDYTALYAKYSKRFEPQDMDNLKPVTSGIIGHVSLIEEPSN
jgi:hypothetical protein